MRIVSFNILSDDYVDFNNQAFLHKYYRGVKPAMLAWKARKRRIVQKIKQLDGDIYLLQEVMRGARVTFKRHFSDYHVGPIAYHALPIDKTNRNRTGNMILIRKSLCNTSPTFKTADIGYGYKISVAIIKELVIVSLHFIDTHKKYQQAKNLQKILQAEPIRDNQLIVGGDFNCKSVKMAKMFQDLVKNKTVCKSSGTYLCQRPMIDYIYTSLPVKTCAIDNGPMDSPSCRATTLESVGSDHYPVIIDTK